MANSAICAGPKCKRQFDPYTDYQGKPHGGRRLYHSRRCQWQAQLKRQGKLGRRGKMRQCALPGCHVWFDPRLSYDDKWRAYPLRRLYCSLRCRREALRIGDRLRRRVIPVPNIKLCACGCGQSFDASLTFNGKPARGKPRRYATDSCRHLAHRPGRAQSHAA